MPTVALLVRISDPGSRYTLFARPASVTVPRIRSTVLPRAAVTSEIRSHGIVPPKYRGSPAGRGEPPRTTRASVPSGVAGHRTPVPAGVPNISRKSAPDSSDSRVRASRRRARSASSRPSIPAIRRCPSGGGTGTRISATKAGRARISEPPAPATVLMKLAWKSSPSSSWRR
jgi:hypothetical protein